MPRDGSGVYSAPAGTTASPNTTIESSKYNALVADLVSDANAARPITSGGTGETSAILPDDTWRFTNTADPTKKLAFGLTPVPTGTTVTAIIPAFGGVMDIMAQGADIASAATTNLGGSTGSYVRITGTTTITSLGSASAGIKRTVQFLGSLTLTHSTSLVLPGNANIQTAAGDVAVFISDGSSSWRCVSYTVRAAAPYVASSWTPTLTFGTPGNLSVSYTIRSGSAIKIGNLVVASFNVVTSAFTHTTASGNATITGLPYAAETSPAVDSWGAVNWAGVTKAGYTQIMGVVGSTSLVFYASGSGVARSVVTAADMPTGGSVVLSGTICYIADT
jgi:hypothetical protein